MIEIKTKPLRRRSNRSLSSIVRQPERLVEEKVRSFTKAAISSNPETARMQEKIQAHNKAIQKKQMVDESEAKISPETKELFQHIPPRKTRP